MHNQHTAILRTMDAIAEANLRFDTSASGDVQYSHALISDVTTEDYWEFAAARNVRNRTSDGEYSRYGLEPVFTPSWLNGLSDENHHDIEVFLRDHAKSFWAVDGLTEALLHQCMSTDPAYAYLLRNFMLLWDDTTRHVIESDDCYSLCAIKGIGGVDVRALPLDQREGYRALAGFAVISYIAGLDGEDDELFVVAEDVVSSSYAVQEPFRSMVMKYPSHTQFIFDYLTAGYSPGDHERLLELLQQRTPTPLISGLL